MKTTEDNESEIYIKASKLEKLSFKVSAITGKLFYKLGFAVADSPWKTIGLCWLTVAICCLGFINFNNEKDPLKLWVPANSKFLTDTRWIIDKFKEGTRIQSVLITADDVLTSEVLQQLEIISREITTMQTRNDNNEVIDWNKVCFKIPFIANFTVDEDDHEDRRRKKRAVSSNQSTGNNFDDDFFDDEIKVDKKKFHPSVHMDPKTYCNIINKLPLGCLQQNVLELWKNDKTKISQLSKENIVKALNKTTVGPLSGHETPFSSLLGGIQRNEAGEIITAKSILTLWMLHVNFSHVENEKIGNLAGTEDWTTSEILAFEEKFLEVMTKLKKELELNSTVKFEIYYSAGRSFGDISSAALFRDMDKLSLGILVMLLYMQLVLSKFSWIELRTTLTFLGLLSVGMAYISGCGLASLFMSYGPVHTSLPFLLMGLGVDDIFVIMASWRRIQVDCIDKPLPHKMGLMLQHAGVSITITSLTDIVAFLVGGTTILPSLQSFCIFASLSIFMTFIFVITFFVAIFTLDERRINQNRNSFVPCLIHEENKKKLWCEPNFTDRAIKWLYSNVILTKLGKTFVILSVICVTGFSIKHVLKLRQKFDYAWFIPTNTYLHQYTQHFRQYYPERGYEASVFLGQLNYTTDINKILRLSNQLENQTVLNLVQSWTTPFKDFVLKHYDKDIRTTVLTDQEWKFYLSKFLFSPEGGKFQAHFRFASKLKCGEESPDVIVSSIDFNFHKFEERDEYIPAKNAISELITDSDFNSGDKVAFLWGKVFGNWITDEVIDDEIYRNILLALIGVFVCTAILIVNFQTCFYIFICVLLTLINVGGMMEVLGLTLDLVTCISLQLAVGLCVDYAAHIGHTFLMISGDRNQRALETVSYIGSAVMYGGGSTMLAVSMLSFSDAYTYRTFHKVFTAVVIYGLYFGLVFLPVVLSIIGPKPLSLIMMKDKKIDGVESLPLKTKNDISDIEHNDKNASELDATLPAEEIEQLKP